MLHRAGVWCVRSNAWASMWTSDVCMRTHERKNGIDEVEQECQMCVCERGQANMSLGMIGKRVHASVSECNWWCGHTDSEKDCEKECMQAWASAIGDVANAIPREWIWKGVCGFQHENNMWMFSVMWHTWHPSEMEMVGSGINSNVRMCSSVCARDSVWAWARLSARDRMQTRLWVSASVSVASDVAHKSSEWKCYGGNDGWWA